MADIQDLNIVDASNTGRWPENMQFSAVNDAGRADEGLLARWYKDMDASLTASGSPNAYAVTSNRTISSLANNTMIVFTANFTNTGSATLNLNGLGAKTIKRFTGANLSSGDVTSGQPVSVIYKSSPDVWYMMNAASALISAGTTIDLTESSPSAPSANVARFFASDDGGGVTVLALIDSGSRFSYFCTANQAEMEAQYASRCVSPQGMKWHPGMPKAWGFVSSGGSVNASHGISGVSHLGTGQYQVTLSPGMSSTSYCILAVVEYATGSVADGKILFTSITSSSTFNIYTSDATAGVSQDQPFHFCVFGDMS